MSETLKKHQIAMDIAEKAFVLKSKGETEEAFKLLKESYILEKEVALSIKEDKSNEPTRSVLLRSAASLALQCNEYRESERLISIGLSGDPPDQIAEELRDLIEQVNFNRHLELRGVTLDPGEFQLSITGNVVGLGIANTNEFVNRVEIAEKIIQRTAERKLGIPFREKGPIKKEISQGLELFISIPRAASFAVSIKIGSAKGQLTLPHPGFNIYQEIVDDIMFCLDTFNVSEDKKIKEYIKDDAYYRSFVGLARRIAPDGDKVKMVGLTSLSEGKKKSLAITRIQQDVTFIQEKEIEKEKEKAISIIGELRFADSITMKKNKIKLIDEKGIKHNIFVPEGMMDDIVKPLWGEKVIVFGNQIGKTINLIDIKKNV